LSGGYCPGGNCPGGYCPRPIYGPNSTSLCPSLKNEKKQFLGIN
jgi:hypothetical protein